MEQENIRNPEVNRPPTASNNPKANRNEISNSNPPVNRNLTVSSGCDAKYNPVPLIRLQGKWLAELGFDIGDKIVVECQEGRLVITKLKLDTN